MYIYIYRCKRPTVNTFFHIPKLVVRHDAQLFNLPKEKSRIKIPVRFEKESIRDLHRPHIKSESSLRKHILFKYCKIFVGNINQS